MANENQPRDERIGRGQKEGLDGGRSRNAHMSGERGREHVEDAGKGAGGYGDDTGFSGGTRAPRDAGRGEGGEQDRDRGTSSGDMQPGAGGTYDEPSATEARTRTGAVGKQAPSGMDEPARGDEHG